MIARGCQLHGKGKKLSEVLLKHLKHNREQCEEINYYILHLLTQMLSLNHSEECRHSAKLQFDLFFLILIIILMKRIQRGLKQELILVLHQPLPWKAHHLNPWKRKQGQALT